MGQADTFNSPQLKKLHEQATKDKDLQKIVAKLEKRLETLFGDLPSRNSLKLRYSFGIMELELNSSASG